MMRLNEMIPGHERIKNIIFDFGGVICDLDIPKTEQKFLEFGPPRSSRPLTADEQNSMWEELVGKYETGSISSTGFRQAIRDFYLSSPSDGMIDEAWNALLNDIPEERLRLLEEVRKSYRIFLLSNSNPIHYQHFARKFSDQTGYKDMDGLFEKAYFSFNIGLRKPDPEIFRLVLNNHGLIASETLFIDDTREHILSAGKIGIVGFHLKEGLTIEDLFKKLNS